MISADAAATHQAVVRVMEAARLAGLSQITFTTQSSKVSAALVPPRRPRVAAVAGEPRCSLSWCRAAPASLPRCGFCRSAHPGIPVIVVGNLSVGGTGKTPLVHLDRRIPQAQGLVAGDRLARLWRRGRRRRAPRRSPPRPPRSATSRPARAAQRLPGVDRRRSRRRSSRRCAQRIRKSTSSCSTTACSTTACGATSRSRWSMRAASATASCCRPGRCASRASAAAHRSTPLSRIGAARTRTRLFAMRLEGDVAAPHDRRAPSGSRCERLRAARRCTRSPASAIRTASSCTWASSASKVVPHPFPDHHPLRRRATSSSATSCPS